MSGGWRQVVRRRADSRVRQGGAVAVEFALVLPILIAMLIGTVTGGLAYSQSIGLTNAVREGARFGATADITSAGWATAVISRTRATQFDDGADAATSSTSVCVELRGSTSIGPVCDPGTQGTPATAVFGGTAPTPPAGECIVVVYAARYFEIITGLSSPLDGDIQKWSVARYEGPC
jgi:Flp pilus assembly protein TadG